MFHLHPSSFHQPTVFRMVSRSLVILLAEQVVDSISLLTQWIMCVVETDWFFCKAFGFDQDVARVHIDWWVSSMAGTFPKSTAKYLEKMKDNSCWKNKEWCKNTKQGVKTSSFLVLNVWNMLNVWFFCFIKQPQAIAIGEQESIVLKYEHISVKTWTY